MAKNREIVCRYYICENNKCKKNRDACFYGYCQTCNFYDPIRRGIPNRKDKRQKKQDDFSKKELRDYDK